MSYNKELDKDRLYFTQNNTPIRLQCPECVRTLKSLRHCKIFKNLPGLWWHLKQGHGYISNLLFTTEDVIDVLNATSKAIEWGIIPKPLAVFIEPTTTSSLKYKGKPPRKDVYEKLQKIAELYKNQSHDYPIFNLKQIRTLVGVILGQIDDRTRQHYVECIQNASEKNMVKGTIDVTQFCEEFESGL